MRPWTRWCIVLGFALGGFFDGILLHQILQWHHLFSLVPGVDTLRAQVLWDGFFHASMYLLALVGLWGLWRARPQMEGWRRGLAGPLLLGFGAWHAVDSVLSHWVLGIHRVKLDSPNPLVWDLIWFVAFGVIPLVAGSMLMRKRHPPAGDLRGSTTAVLCIGLLGASLAAWSLQPPPGQRFTTIVFAPNVRPGEVVNALASADARLVWADRGMGVIIADVPNGNRFGFYRKGAMLVSGSGLAGCFNWSRPA